ncbi:MAG: hypothetical protein RSA79_05670 [Oscillospiraceae bacterium]
MLKKKLLSLVLAISTCFTMGAVAVNAENKVTKTNWYGATGYEYYMSPEANIYNTVYPGLPDTHQFDLLNPLNGIKTSFIKSSAPKKIKDENDKLQPLQSLWLKTKNYNQNAPTEKEFEAEHFKTLKEAKDAAAKSNYKSPTLFDITIISSTGLPITEVFSGDITIEFPNTAGANIVLSYNPTTHAIKELNTVASNGKLTIKTRQLSHFILATKTATPVKPDPKPTVPDAKPVTPVKPNPVKPNPVKPTPKPPVVNETIKDNETPKAPITVEKVPNPPSADATSMTLVVIAGMSIIVAGGFLAMKAKKVK